MNEFLKSLFDNAMKYLESAVGQLKPGYVLAGVAVLLVAAFAVFAICKLGSRARRETKLLKRAAAAVSEKGINDAEDAAGLGKAFQKSAALSFSYKRFYASETLTAYDTFKGKAKRSGIFALALTLALILSVGMAVLLYCGFSNTANAAASGIGKGQAFAMCALFAVIAVALVWIFAAIARAQVKHRNNAERRFAEVLDAALPVAKKNRLKNNESPRRAVQFEEVKAEHVEANESDVENFAQKTPESAVGQDAPAESPEQTDSVESSENAVAVKSESSVDEIIRKINEVRTNGASVQTMQQIAMLLQKEREKKENKTVAQQRKLNEALAELLRAMSRYQK